MAEISAKDVKALREKTGAGMMDCKKALSEAGGDVEKATELLRERGLSKAGKRAGRETSEGSVGIAIEGGRGVIIELGCETDFVAKNEQFQTLVQEVADAALAAGAGDAAAALAAKVGDASVEEHIQNNVGRLGENIQLKRVALLEGDGVVGGYVHGTGGIGVIVAIQSSSPGDLGDVPKDVAMHVAAHDPTPLAVDEDGVDPAVVEKERDFLTKQALESGKPESIVENMVNGRMKKFFAENCLNAQGFVKDPDQKVGAYVKAAGGASVSDFVRFKLGEGADQ